MWCTKNSYLLRKHGCQWCILHRQKALPFALVREMFYIIPVSGVAACLDATWKKWGQLDQLFSHCSKVLQVSFHFKVPYHFVSWILHTWLAYVTRVGQNNFTSQVWSRILVSWLQFVRETYFLHFFAVYWGGAQLINILRNHYFYPEWSHVLMNLGLRMVQASFYARMVILWFHN